MAKLFLFSLAMMLLVSNFINCIPINDEGWGAGEFEHERDIEISKRRVWPGQFKNEKDMEISKRGVTDYIVKLSW